MTKLPAKRSPRSIDVAVGREVRSVRLLRGWSQGRLGAALGITFQQVQKYEKGHNRIGMSRMAQICDALDITIDHFAELMNIKGQKAVKLSGLDMMTDPIGVDIAQLWVKLNRPQRTALRHMVRTLIAAEAGE